MITIRRTLLMAALSLALVASVAPAVAGGTHHVPSYGGPGHGGGGGHGHGHGGGGGWYGGWYGGYYGPSYWDYSYGPYGYYGPYSYPYPAEAPDFAIVDCDVDPEEAKVYLDGERLGEADDFDGFPNYLTVPSGHHIIEFRRRGHQTLRLEIEVQAGRYYAVDRKLHAGDINGKPQVEQWGPPRRETEEEDIEALPPPRTHHYNEKPRDPKTADPKGDPGDASDDTSTPTARKAEPAPSPQP